MMPAGPGTPAGVPDPRAALGGSFIASCACLCNGPATPGNAPGRGCRHATESKGLSVPQEDNTGCAEGIELRLTVWTEAKVGWHARVVAADETVREFESPFELVRFLLWPARPTLRGEGRGLR